MLWWKKPLDVDSPTLINAEDMTELAAFMALCSSPRFSRKPRYSRPQYLWSLASKHLTKYGLLNQPEDPMRLRQDLEIMPRRLHPAHARRSCRRCTKTRDSLRRYCCRDAGHCRLLIWRRPSSCVAHNLQNQDRRVALEDICHIAGCLGPSWCMCHLHLSLVEDRA
jgi:hypothetical protein